MWPLEDVQWSRSLAIFEPINFYGTIYFAVKRVWGWKGWLYITKRQDGGNVQLH